MSNDDVTAAFEKAGQVQASSNHYQKAMQSQFVGQWITSLAISVICCAVLFVVFAGYIVQLHEKANLSEVRIELLQEKYSHLTTDIMALRRQPPQAIFNIQGGGAPQVTEGTEPAAPVETGVEPASSQEPANQVIGVSPEQPPVGAATENKQEVPAVMPAPDMGIAVTDPAQAGKPAVK